MARFLKIFLVFLAAGVILVLLRPVISARLASSSPLKEGQFLAAAKITGEDASHYRTLGDLGYAARDEEGLRKALIRYGESIARNPADGRAWLGLAKALNETGRKDGALSAVRMAARVDRIDKTLQWEAGIFLLLNNRILDAIPFFRQYVTLVPSELGNVALMLYTIGLSPPFILETFVPESYTAYRSYLNFLMQHGRVNESQEVWDRMGNFSRSREDHISYLNFLIAANAMDKAQPLWQEYVKQFGLIADEDAGENLIWNGSFELPIQDGGFDWQIGEAEGVRVFLDQDVKRSGYSSLSAQFFGTANPEIYLAQQVVPVVGGRAYLLMARIATDDLTTTNGILLEVSGHACVPFVSKTAPVTGSTLWQEAELAFTAPAPCKAIRVGIKREKSEKFDNKISGDVWVDSVVLIPARKDASAQR
jgi:tetratricopeptide (TPR) repeat protein